MSLISIQTVSDLSGTVKKPLELKSRYLNQLNIVVWRTASVFLAALETPIADLLLAQTGSKRGSDKSGKPSIRITILHMYGDMISMRSPVQKI